MLDNQSLEQGAESGPATTIARRLFGLTARRPGFALTLCGEAGIGKSFTARTLLQHCSCVTFSSPATRPIAELLLSLPRPRVCPAPLEQVLNRLEQGEEPQQEVARVTLMALLSAQAPAVLYIEDLHEATPETVRDLTWLAERVSSLRGVALLSSSRTAPPPPFEVSVLERMTGAQSRALLEAEIHAPLSSEACDWIYARAAGNPLYTLEFFRSLARAGYAWSDGHRWNWRTPPEALIPASVEAVIERALFEAVTSGTDPGETRQALDTLALLPDADETLLCAVSQLGTVQFRAALSHLRARGVLTQAGFAHPLYRERTIQNLKSGQRAELSRRALDALEHSDIEAAAGFVPDARLETPRALELLKGAARQACERGDQARAGRFLALAVELAGEPERGELALQGAQLLLHSAVGEAYLLAQEAARSLPLRLEATFVMAHALAVQNREAEAEALLERLEPEARSQRVFALRTLHLRGMAHNFEGVLKLFGAQPDLLDLADAQTVAYVARALAQHGQVVRAEAMALEALEHITDPRLRATVQRARSHIAYVMGNFAAMETLEAGILQVARQHHDLRLMDQALYNRALALEALGRYQEQKASLEQAMAVCRDLGDSTAYMIAQAAYAGMLAEFGDYQRAEDLLTEARTHLEHVSLSGYLLSAEVGLVQLYLDWRPSHGVVLALRHIRSALGHARLLGRPFNLASTLGLAAVVQMTAGDTGQALTLAGEALTLARTLPSSLALAEVLGACGRVYFAAGQRAQALELLSEAVQLADRLASPRLIQMLALEAACMAGHLEAARDRLPWFESRGLISGANLLKRYFPDASSGATTAISALNLGVLGPLLMNGQPIRGGKRRELLTRLLAARIAGRQELAALTLLDALYPGEDEAAAHSALKQTVFTTRSSYGNAVIVTTSGGYALGQVASDAEVFLRTGNSRLWRGTCSMPQGDDTASESLTLALRSVTHTVLKRDPHEAARLARLLCEMNLYDVQELKLLCEALRLEKNYRSLAREYERGRRRMLEVGELLPLAWADFLAVSPAQASADTVVLEPSTPA